MKFLSFSWTVWTWQFKVDLQPKALSQILQMKFLSLSWTVWTWQFKVALWPNALSQRLQMKFLLLSRTIGVRQFKLDRLLKSLSQEYSFPVWWVLLICWFKFASAANSFPQSPHLFTLIFSQIIFKWLRAKAGDEGGCWEYTLHSFSWIFNLRNVAKYLRQLSHRNILRCWWYLACLLCNLRRENSQSLRKRMYYWMAGLLFDCIWSYLTRKYVVICN